VSEAGQPYRISCAAAGVDCVHERSNGNHHPLGIHHLHELSDAGMHGCLLGQLPDFVSLGLGMYILQMLEEPRLVETCHVCRQCNVGTGAELRRAAMT
jgi:hypothetical protein